MPDTKGLLEFYDRALSYLTANGYLHEIEYVEQITPFEELGSEGEYVFIQEYIWVVLNAGMREQAARKIFDRFFENNLDLSIIRHESKRAAIKQALECYPQWYADLVKSEDKVSYLQTLPWIGATTKHHLARNIGIVDTVKPDRHLVRLAERFGYASPLEMCQDIKTHNGTRLGVIDIILWRYMNLKEGTMTEKYN